MVFGENTECSQITRRVADRSMGDALGLLDGIQAVLGLLFHVRDDLRMVGRDLARGVSIA